jgi:hypothetical protein
MNYSLPFLIFSSLDGRVKFFLLDPLAGLSGAHPAQFRMVRGVLKRRE